MNHNRISLLNKAFRLVLKALESRPTDDLKVEWAQMVRKGLEDLGLEVRDQIRIIRQAREHYALSLRTSYLDLARAHAIPVKGIYLSFTAQAANLAEEQLRLREVKAKADRLAEKAGWKALLELRAQQVWDSVLKAQKKGRVTWQGAAASLKALNGAINKMAKRGKEVAAATLNELVDKLSGAARITVENLSKMLGFFDLKSDVICSRMIVNKFVPKTNTARLPQDRPVKTYVPQVAPLLSGSVKAQVVALEAYNNSWVKNHQKSGGSKANPGAKTTKAMKANYVRLPDWIWTGIRPATKVIEVAGVVINTISGFPEKLGKKKVSQAKGLGGPKTTYSASQPVNTHTRGWAKKETRRIRILELRKLKNNNQ